MSERTERRKAIKDAANALADLHIFHAIIAILEGGTIHTASHRGADRIISICKSETAKRLREYDRAVELAGGAAYGEKP